MKPKLIAFEGPDCVGKTTQVEEIKQALRIKGYKVVSHKIPYTQEKTTYDVISSLLEKGLSSQYPFLFQGAMIDNRRAFQSDIIENSINDIILVDRWNLSTLFYGEAQGISQETSLRLLEGIREPDVYVIFDGVPFDRKSKDHLDRDMTLQSFVRSRYEHHIGSNVFHVKTSKPILEITRRILVLLQDMIVF